MNSDVIEFCHENDDGVETTYVIPSKFEVCHGCAGKGTHVNPSIDGHGISREEFDEDPDFEEAYFNGVYDVQCYTCHGRRVVLEVDWSSPTFDPKVKELYEEHLQDEAEYRSACAAERRMGA